jgi:16S rRNA (cytosine1402-N4)-methyltransferase
MNTESNNPEQSPQSRNSSSRRRLRYSGRYPRNFDEKYKEHQGDEATIVKVLNKGMTPAGTHVPIMLSECLEYMGLLMEENITPPPLQQQQQQLVVVDCTLGYGGHAEHILQALEKKMPMGGGKLFAFDQDSIEIVKTSERLRSKSYLAASNNVEFVPVNQNFATVKSYLEESSSSSSSQQQQQLGQVTCLLADLGLSSMQIDDNKRGFTYKREGPLDMRMNPNEQSRETAYQLLKRLKPKEFQRMLEENSDEIYAKEIAFGLLGMHKNVVVIPETTLELANRVRDIVQPLLLEKHNLLKKNNDLKPALDSTVARTMQAIRIEVNGEFQALDQLLEDLPDILKPGGKAVFLTFHSGEDRRVKKALKDGFKNGIYSSWSRNVVRPSSLERRNNPRSSCCKLRWAVKQQQQQV